MTTALNSSAEGVPVRWIIVVLCLSFLLRITSVLINPRAPVSDEVVYDALARSLVHDHSYSIDGVPTAYRPPGYPAFLAVIYGLFGPNQFAAKAVQALLDSITAVILFVIARKVSPKAGIIAGALWCIFPPAILYVNYLLSESLTVFLVALSLLWMYDTSTRLSPRWLLAGLTIGFLILTKPIFLLLPVLLLTLGKKLNMGRINGVVLAGAVLLVLAPWIVRNQVELGYTGLSTNGGMNLFIGNNPDATGSFQGKIPPELAVDSIDEVARDRKAFSLATGYILAHPATFILNGGKKIAHLFRTEGDVLIGSFSWSAPAGVTGFLDRYALIPIIPVVVTNAAYFFVVLLAIAGAFWAPRDGAYWFSCALFGTILLVHFVYFGGSRHHFPLMPIAVLFAASALGLRGGGWWKRSRWSIPVFLASGLALVTIWSYELILVYSR